jgi:hypothetical protein
MAVVVAVLSGVGLWYQRQHPEQMRLAPRFGFEAGLALRWIKLKAPPANVSDTRMHVV